MSRDLHAEELLTQCRKQQKVVKKQWNGEKKKLVMLLRGGVAAVSVAVVAGQRLKFCTKITEGLQRLIWQVTGDLNLDL